MQSSKIRKELKKGVNTGANMQRVLKRNPSLTAVQQVPPAPHKKQSDQVRTGCQITPRRMLLRRKVGYVQ